MTDDFYSTIYENSKSNDQSAAASNANTTSIDNMQFSKDLQQKNKVTNTRTTTVFGERSTQISL